MKKYLEIGLNIIFWVLTSSILFEILGIRQTEIEIVDGKEVIYNTVESSQILSFSIGIFIKGLVYYSHIYVISKLLNQKKYKQYCFQLTLVTVIAFLLEYLKFGIIHSNWSYSWDIFILNVWLYAFFIGVSFAHLMILRWQADEKLKQQLKEDKLNAELQLLKSQINPHFLFNALNNLMAISEKHKQEEISEGISQLSEMLRFLLYDTSDNKIELKKEVEFIKNYIQINKLRFDKNDPIKINFSYNISHYEVKIAPALLIPIVENAFKHGIDIYTDSYIDIDLNGSKDYVEFTCINSIVQRAQNKINDKNSGVGLKNIRRRLSILYPNNYSFDIKRDDNCHSVILKLNI